MGAFTHDNTDAAFDVEPLEEIIDRLKEKLRANHIQRLQKGGCSIDAGFIWSDLLTNLERISDHCSNIAGCIIETSHQRLNLHENVRLIKSDSENFRARYLKYQERFSVPEA